MTSALLFDLDGTLVDTDAEHLVAFQRALAPHGILLDRTEYVASIMGASNEMIGRKFLPHLPHDLREQTLAAKEQAYRDGLGDLEPIAGIAALLDWADGHGLARAASRSGCRSASSAASSRAPSPTRCRI
jgi:beta-phosphoglucomutase-like phosphatase (HAD superfamily)